MSDHEIPEEIARRLRPLGDTPAPDAGPALAAFLADPVAALTSDLSATAASDVNRPGAAAAARAAGLPKRRRTMTQALGELLGAVARLGLVGKVALGAGALGRVRRERFRIQQRLVARVIACARIQHPQQVRQRRYASD